MRIVEWAASVQGRLFFKLKKESIQSRENKTRGGQDIQNWIRKLKPRLDEIYSFTSNWFGGYGLSKPVISLLWTRWESPSSTEAQPYFHSNMNNFLSIAFLQNKSSYLLFSCNVFSNSKTSLLGFILLTCGHSLNISRKTLLCFFRVSAVAFCT